ncbi:hypothetical protein [Lentzea sp. NBRC 102530]|uniref:hypothetical protein n=1 Tax=Lentzea sp. NBRC 102530 TaxID=3032201 RepID=UPI00249F9DCE|nr:hypothetical protein [Lentzea sp. NBRC 102530]GLY51824.1 hypothetical protein Lesp01_54800 [Lentzea sp. NBRC 102530]
MTRSDEPKPSGDDAAVQRRRRLAEVFGDVLPETTSDERGERGSDDRESWYRENRPPHHGG